MDADLTADIETGNEKLDEQHRELFRRIEALRSSVREGGGRQEMARMLEYLERYTAEHFALEESYMRRFLYPAILSHRAEHDAFSREVADYRTRWKDLDARGEYTSFLEIEMERRFTAWLKEHIGNHDRPLAAFLRGHL